MKCSVCKKECKEWEPRRGSLAENYFHPHCLECWQARLDNAYRPKKKGAKT